jgi:hypothetical protein
MSANSSEPLHIWWVRHGKIELGANNRRYVGANVPDFVMNNTIPELPRGYQLTGTFGADAAALR